MGMNRRMAKFLTPYKKKIIVKILLGIAIMAFGVTRAFAMAKGATAVLRGDAKNRILVFIAIALVSIVIKAILVYQNEIYSKKVACRIKNEIRGQLLDKLYALGPAYQTNKRSGRIQSLISDGVEALESYLAYYIPQVFISLVTVAVLITYLIRVDRMVGILILFSVVIAVVGPQLSRTVFQNSTTEYWKAYAVLNAQYIDTMQGMNTLKAFNSSKEKGKELGENCWDFYRKQIRSTAVGLLDGAFVTFCTAIGTTFSVGLAAYHAANGKVDIAALLSVLFLIPECFRPIGDLNNFWHSSYMGFSVVDQLFEIMDEKVPVKEKENAEESGLAEHLPTVHIKDVTFAYRKEQDKVLDKVSLDITSGQQVAVCGKSGSGKSTIVNLLLRFYDLKSGECLYNGVDIREYSMDYLRKNIAVVFQDTYLFYGTIRENIALARPDATEKEIIHAAKIANIHDFIEKLPEGYDTLVGERGANFSGGERQRIAIARAVIKNAPFLILDEATASVDAENEKSIIESLQILMQNKTTLVIAHRMSTIMNADCIYVLEDGVVREKGKHEALLAQNGIYTKLISAQNMSWEGRA